MFARVRVALGLGLAVLTAGVVALSPMPGHAAAYQVFVTNEKSGDVTVIDGGDYKVLATIPVGKRPRGIHASPDGKTVYVAVSGTPVSGPPRTGCARESDPKKER